MSLLQIKGFLENSLLEWDGRIASVIFLPGCNFRCPWCHVPELAFHPEELETVPFEEVSALLAKGKGWIDGVAISGGEPLLHPELPKLIKRIKALGFPVKIETNGSFPERLEQFIKEGLIDCAAMDIKNVVTPGKEQQYQKTVGGEADLKAIRKSIDILLQGKIDYEFRTTVVPSFLQEEDIRAIAQAIPGAKKYILQQFVPEHAAGENMRKVTPYAPEKLNAWVEIAREYVKNSQARGI